MRDDISGRLDTAGDRVLTEVTRADTKAQILLAVDAVLVAGLAALASHMPTAAVVVAAVAAAAMVAGATLAILVMRPRLGGGGGFTDWAVAVDSTAVIDTLRADHRADHLRVMSRITVRKMRLLRRAADCTLVAVALVAVAGVVTGVL